MKKLILLALFAIPFIFSGCGDDFLNQKNLFEKDSENYYRNPTDIAEALAGAYSCLAIDAGANHPILVANLMSDDEFSGGGTNDIQTIGTDQYTNPTEDLYLPAYRRNYEGIFIINSLLDNFKNANFGTDTVSKNQALGEAHFLRAMFYFRLAQLFGDVPLDLDPKTNQQGRATAAEIYAQIASDLKTAVSNLPNKPYTAATSGHATKWAAQALMARVFLFYTGFYQSADLPVAGGSTVTKAEVIAMLDDCITNSGHALLSDYRSIWPFSYLLDNSVDTLTAEIKNYKLAKDVTFAGDGNKETVFAVKYSRGAWWGGQGRLSFSNQLCLYTSPRATDYRPFGFGWGIGAVNTQLRDSYVAADTIRRWSTIIDNTVSWEPTYGSKYSWGGWNCANETGLWDKKHSAVCLNRDLTDNGKNDPTWIGMYEVMTGGDGTLNMQLWNMQDDILIRWADVLLMHSELTQTATGINAVRARVNLPSVTYSLANLKNERRWELALEGLRWYDLLRWGDAQTAINACNGVPIKTDNVSTTYSVTFRADRVFGPFPESQIKVSNGMIEQSSGWQ